MTALPSTTSLPLWGWGGFLLFIAIMLALDLGVFRRKAKAIGMKEALARAGIHRPNVVVARQPIGLRVVYRLPG